MRPLPKRREDIRAADDVIDVSTTQDSEGTCEDVVGQTMTDVLTDDVIQDCDATESYDDMDGVDIITDRSNCDTMCIYPISTTSTRVLQDGGKATIYGTVVTDSHLKLHNHTSTVVEVPTVVNSILPELSPTTNGSSVLGADIAILVVDPHGLSPYSIRNISCVPPTVTAWSPQPNSAPTSS